MNRRSLLGRILALLAAPFVPKPPIQLWPDGPDYSEITRELKRVYPPGAFARAVERESPMMRYLKGNPDGAIDTVRQEKGTLYGFPIRTDPTLDPGMMKLEGTAGEVRIVGIEEPELEDVDREFEGLDWDCFDEEE
ncbi:MAG: hypothetical protein PVI01_15375 [Gemmatimonadales bacterium]